MQQKNNKNGCYFSILRFCNSHKNIDFRVEYLIRNYFPVQNGEALTAAAVVVIGIVL